MPTALIVIIGIAAFIGMIVCAKMKEKPQAKPLAGLFLAVLVICAGMYLHNNGIFTGEDKETRDQRASYARFEESTAKALGGASGHGRVLQVRVRKSRDRNTSRAFWLESMADIPPAR